MVSTTLYDNPSHGILTQRALAALRDRDRDLLEAVRCYVAATVIPARAELDAVASRDTFPIGIVQPGIDLGLKSLAMDAADGGAGATSVLLGLVVEELARGDLSVAYYFKHNWRFSRLIPRLPEPLRKDVAENLRSNPWYLAASAITEEESGTDNHLRSDDPAVGMRLQALRDGDQWVLNGTKVMITNATMAGIYFVAARTDPTVPTEQGVTLIAVPGDADGISYGEPYGKLGQRASIQTDVTFHDCRVPLDYAVSDVGGGQSAARKGATTGSNIVNAFMSIGVARSAYEEALNWCTIRVQGGCPIYKHQLVAHQLGQMKVEIDAALSYALLAAEALDGDGPEHAAVVAWGANVVASEMVVRVARAGMELFGGRGMMAGWPLEKIVRDALTLQHGFGTNPVTLTMIGSAEAEAALHGRPVVRAATA